MTDATYRVPSGVTQAKNKLLSSNDPLIIQFVKGGTDHFLEKAISHFRFLDGKHFNSNQWEMEKSIFLDTYFMDLSPMVKTMFFMQNTMSTVNKVLYIVFVS